MSAEDVPDLVADADAPEDPDRVARILAAREAEAARLPRRQRVNPPTPPPT